MIRANQGRIYVSLENQRISCSGIEEPANFFLLLPTYLDVDLDFDSLKIKKNNNLSYTEDRPA